MSSCNNYSVNIFIYTVILPAPGSSPEITYVDSPAAAVPPEASYDEDWEVFDPWVTRSLII